MTEPTQKKAKTPREIPEGWAIPKADVLVDRCGHERVKRILKEKILQIEKIISLSPIICEHLSADFCMDLSKGYMKLDQPILALAWYKMAMDKGVRDENYERDLITKNYNGF